MVLDNLYQELGVTDSFTKALVSAMVFGVLENNPYGMNEDNKSKVKEELIAGICSEFEFNILLLATEWSNDVADILEHKLQSKKPVYHSIFCYVTGNEIVPGVGGFNPAVRGRCSNDEA